MNCERFQTMVDDLTRNEIPDRRSDSAGVMPPRGAIMEVGDRTSALEHIDECQRCAQAWKDQRELSEGLRTVAQHMKSLQAPAHLEERLLVAFRQRSQVRSSRSMSPRWRHWASAAAAALLIFFGLIAWRTHVASLSRSRIQAKTNSGTTPQAQSPKPDQSPLAVTGANQAPQRAVPSHGVAANRRRAKGLPAGPHTSIAPAKGPGVEAAATPAANTDTREVVTDFVALGYGSALDLQDGGQLVRVELPRSALARFGLPMNMDRADERIKADVLVGTDGLARAIRFVK